MMSRYGIDTADTCHGYGRDMGLTQKIEVSYTLWHDMLPMLKSEGIVVKAMHCPKINIIKIELIAC